MGCLSKFSIKDVKDIRLKQNKGDRHFRIIQRLIFNINSKNLIVYHTHYSNRDDFAKWQLEETMNLVNSEKSIPLIVGDLNIRITNDINEVSGEKYKSSWDKKNYFGYPSHNEILDYVLIPKNWNFEKIICNKDGLSDHRPLIAVIDIPN